MKIIEIDDTYKIRLQRSDKSGGATMSWDLLQMPPKGGEMITVQSGSQCAGWGAAESAARTAHARLTEPAEPASEEAPAEGPIGHVLDQKTEEPTDESPSMDKSGPVV